MKRLAGTAVAALLLAGCAGGEDVSPQRKLELAAERTTEAGSSRIDLQATTSGLQGGSFVLEGRGEFDYTEREGTFSMTLPQMQGVAGGEVRSIFKDDAIYMRIPQMSEQLPQGKSWIKIDLVEAAEHSGVDMNALMQLSDQSDPSKFLHYLQGASEEVSEVGREQVRGASTTHYRAVVDLRDAVARAPEELKPQLRRSIQQLQTQLGTTKIPIEVWIDDEGRARRVTQTIEMTVGGQKVTQEIAMEFFDFGIDVEVQPPDEAEVFDFTRELPSG